MAENIDAILRRFAIEREAGSPLTEISENEFRAALAEAWADGRDDGLDDLGATQVAIDFGELTNPWGR